jgi:hypothetical protein
MDEVLGGRTRGLLCPMPIGSALTECQQVGGCQRDCSGRTHNYFSKNWHCTCSYMDRYWDPRDPQSRSGLNSIPMDKDCVERGLSIKLSLKNAFKRAFSWPFRTSRAAVARYLIAQLCLCVFAQPGNAASGGAETSTAPRACFRAEPGPN